MDKNQRMQNLVREAYERGLFNGTWLYAENGEIVSKGAVGWRDPADTLPMREDSLFDLASVSKNFTSAAVLQPIAFLTKSLYCSSDIDSKMLFM